MAELEGTPSDAAPEVLATGRSDITCMFVSMSARHPEGRDAEYLRWHCFDHRPEQYRLASMRSSIRLVSTPACRAARAVSVHPFDDVDHVMTYFFAETAGLREFGDLSAALRGAGRTPYVLPAVQRGVYGVDGVAAAPRAKVGADVLPWWPAVGVYVLVERGAAGAADLLSVDGVAGAWWGSAAAVDERYSTAAPGTHFTMCFLDDEPAAVAGRLGPVLGQRWTAGVEPVLAAPFHTVLAADVTRSLP